MVSEGTRQIPKFRRETVETAAALARAVEELSQCPTVGVDLEMAQRVERKPGGLQQWRHVLALIQLAGGDLSVVVDPLKVQDLSALRPIMAGPARKVFLGGGQDASLLEGAGIPARNIADVGEIALALFGRREDGMAALAQRIFGISLDKTVRRADWLARPINPVLLSYAHRDAELTLAMYEWFVERYPDVVRYHERAELEPRPPAGTARWLAEILNRGGQDPLVTLMQMGLDPSSDGEKLAADVRAALGKATAPRQINKLLRLSGDLGLRAVLPVVSEYVSSPSSMLRSTAARVIGQLADQEEGEALVKPLLEDPIDEVKRSAEAAIRELKSPTVEPELEEAEEETALGGSALEALQRLRAEMESE
jgi:hypothetical protein